jgi:type VI secretion system secreted protein Hcp
MKSLFFTSIALLFFSSSAVAVDSIYLWLDGIPGESLRADHEDEIDIWSYEWDYEEIEKNGKFGPRIVLEKDVDLSTTKLLMAKASGSPIASGVLAFRPGSPESLFDYLSITINGVTVQRITQSEGPNGVREQVALCFKRISYEYTVQNDDHSEGESNTFSWDMESNKPD